MSRYRVSVILVSVLAFAGCDAPDARFRLNMAYLNKQEEAVGAEFSPEQVQDVADILASMFGTPDQPFVPAAGDSGVRELVSLDRLEMAAGPVSSDEDGTAHGLYRKHCVHCHGITGDGAGPTAAFLNPYPRDYRKGEFKAKSTPIGVRPTDEDLKRILTEGIAGTAMPSFKLLPENELNALVDYVKYLAIRGETERRLFEDLADLGEGERLPTDTEYLIDDVLASVTSRWQQAMESVPEIPARPDWQGEELVASVEKGRELFYGSLANCYSCHGLSQYGDGQLGNYDNWANDFHDFNQTQTDESRQEASARLVALGGLAPRPIRPRNLRSGTFRFGRRPVDLYLRILHGIEGTPMPAATLKPDGAPPSAKGLTSDDIWHLVDYIRSLEYEPAQPELTHEPAFQRERL